MKDVANISSKEELLRLRNEGKVSEDEYNQLFAAMNKHRGIAADTATTREPEFHAFRKRVLIGGMIICWIAIPIGFVLHLPLVWGLGIFGIIVVAIKMRFLNK